MPPSQPLRRLIVNADDFGQSKAINSGIIEAHQRGIVTSASLMVRWPAAAEAAAMAREAPDLSLGLHFDLGEWRHDAFDGWRPVYRVLAEETPENIAAEALRQLELFMRLTGRTPTHLDSHQHVHREAHVLPALARLARELAVPLRDFDPRLRYRGDFYGQTAKGYPVHEAISLPSLLAFLRALPAGLTELGCHPGQPGPLNSMYREERQLELDVLCDVRVRQTLQEEAIQLCSFHCFSGID